MSYTALSSSLIGALKGNFRGLWQVIAANFADHQERLNEIEATFLLVPTGTIIAYPNTSVPSGYLACNGAAVSRQTYAALFAELGTTYGVGDGSTTFNLPDSRGRTWIGKGQGTGLTDRAMGANAGAETHALSTSEIAAHSHSVTDPGHFHTWNNSAQNGANTDAIMWLSNLVNQDIGTAYSSTGISIDNNAGGGGAHANVQPSLVLNMIIKT